jgi:hypothetical protein
MVMELKFVAAQKPKTQNPTVQRRQRLAGRIDQQIALLHGSKIETLPSKSWVWVDEEGACFLSIKYGRQVLELKKGMPSIQCADLIQAVEAFTHVRAMALQGELDDHLTKASTEIRKKFKSTTVA